MRLCADPCKGIDMLMTAWRDSVGLGPPSIGRVAGHLLREPQLTERRAHGGLDIALPRTRRPHGERGRGDRRRGEVLPVQGEVGSDRSPMRAFGHRDGRCN
eukprot:3569481-Heterocapsa_arctica.AAC.1